MEVKTPFHNTVLSGFLDTCGFQPWVKRSFNALFLSWPPFFFLLLKWEEGSVVQAVSQRKLQEKKQLCEARRARTRTLLSTHLLCNLSIVIIKAKHSWASLFTPNGEFLPLSIKKLHALFKRGGGSSCCFIFQNPVPHNTKFTFSTQNEQDIFDMKPAHK